MNDTNNVYTIGERTIYISGEINECSVSQVNAKLIEFITNILVYQNSIKNAQVGHINLCIESTGGNVDDMWALIDLILTSPVPIYTYAFGVVASSALMIFLSGNMRFVSSHTTLMLHELSCAFHSNKTNAIQEWSEMITNEQDKMDNLILHKTKLTKKKLKEIKARKQDYYFSAKEAVELSFADTIFMPTDWSFITGV